tara:strand:+ start:1312 stop:1698 length:387 start_codon:yes stop_codon:yes gene_type:complete
MKYAIINPRGRVARTSDKEFKFTPEDMEVVELTDEQAEQVEASSESLFFVDGTLLTLKAKRWAENPEAVKASLRPERNRLLAESDWTQLNDSPIAEDKVAAWAAYRQDLRDLTENIDNKGEVEFPVAP